MSTTQINLSNIGLITLTLNRPKVANAFDGEMIKELTEHFQNIKNDPRFKESRVLLISGEGKHFSAGADLEWMRAAAKLNLEGNLRDAQLLTELFSSLVAVPIPTIGLVHGSVFGGAVGLVSCMDSVIAAEGTRFSLSEVRLGLAPAVILPFLARRILPHQLRRICLSGQIFSADEALKWGLVHQVVPGEQLKQAATTEINHFLQGSPEAQIALKSYLNRLEQKTTENHSHGAHMIAELRTSTSGQAGLNAFFSRQNAPWVKSIENPFGGPLE